MLDSDQARVVAHDCGPAVVLAGAGSGKTRCTTERAARRLTEAGVPADALLLLTFTNKAAAEMRERLAARLPHRTALPWIGTFHSFGNRLLRSHGEHIGIARNATLMDAEDAGRMLDTLLASPFPNRTLRGEALRVFEAVSAHGLDPTAAEDLPAIKRYCDQAGFGVIAAARFLEVLRRYDRSKRQAGVLDFGDLILLPARLLRQHETLQQQLRDRLRDVTVDEAQDTDGAQFRLLQLLAPADNTVLLVGDDDQAIYEWRHARPQNLREFIERYGATVYRLERNYRSTPAIVTGGAALVRHNPERLEKNPYAVREAPAADGVSLFHYDDGDAMADAIADRIATAIAEGTSAAHLAVLYRKNRLARSIETALLRRGIPYRIKAGTDLLSYADVRMMLAAGRLAANRRDVRALSRLADLIPGLGARGINRLVAAGGDPLRHAALLSPKAAGGVEALAEALARLHADGPDTLLDWCQQTPLFRAWLTRRARGRVNVAAGITDVRAAMRPALARMATVQRAMHKRLESVEGGAPPDTRWATSLEVIASGTDEAESNAARVTLCTIHAAKGLEWPVVHLYGFSEKLMPMERDGSVENLAEERRLAYVALTRAQNRILLHHADRLDLGVGNGNEALAVSRFLDEIGSGQAVQVVDRRAGTTATAGGEDRSQDWLAEMRKAIS